MSLERFMSKVSPEPNSGCWLWDGGYFSNGYARFSESHALTVLAHRYIWKVYFGDIPDKFYICHKCDNMACVNPDHLFLGTPQDNSDDMVAKNRQAKGEKIRPLKLTEDQVRTIKSEISTPIKELVQRYGASHAVIWHVRMGRSYKWVK